MKVKQALVIGALSAGLALGIGISAHAQDIPDFDQEVDKIDVLASTIAGIVSTMTSVTVLPMGISASMRTFRHIVLANV